MLVIGAKRGKMSRISEESKDVNQEFGDSEERVKSSLANGFFAPVQMPLFAAFSSDQKGSRTEMKHADSAFMNRAKGLSGPK